MPGERTTEIVQLLLELPDGDGGGIEPEDGPPYDGKNYQFRDKPRRAMWNEIVRQYGVDIHLEDGLRSGGRSVGIPDLPRFVADILVIAASSGITTVVYQLMKTWVDARNGRKLKIRVGDIEVDATQMKEADVLRIMDLLQEKADRQRIRALLLDTKDEQNPKG